MSAPTFGHSPAISVVTVVRNDLDGLKRTWASLNGQVGPPFEWIVVDGASVDGTRDWLAALADERVTWSSEPDHGIYDAMNKGVLRARADLVWFLNAGDRLASDTTLALANADYRRRGWSWGYGVTVVEDAYGNATDLKHFVPFSTREFELGLKAVPHPSCLFTRSLLSDLGGYDLSVGLAADQELCMRAASRAAPGLIGHVLAVFDSTGISSRQRPDAFVRQARTLRRRHGTAAGGSLLSDAVITHALAVQARFRSAMARTLRRDGRRVPHT